MRRADSRRRAAVLEGMLVKRVFGLRQGDLGGEWKSKMGDFLGSESKKVKRQVFFRKLLEKVGFWEMGLRPFGCRWVLGSGLLIWQRLSLM